MNNEKWFEVLKDGFPENPGIYLCILRGATSLRLMRYTPDRGGWISVGQAGAINKSVTHWTHTATPPPELYMNILLKKSLSEGLDADEKLELAKLLKDSAK